MENRKPQNSLPENAYRELKPGEEYKPLMPASASPAEVTPYSVGMGILMAVIFSAAAAFLGLKVGQVFEAAIPIAIIAVGMGSILGKKNMLGQNVIIQSIGACSGVIVAGAIFTLPALYILGLEAQFYQVFLSSLLGGLLGIVLLIPFRKYFVKEMHGKYPFPEATATTEVLVSGEKGGNQAKLLAVAGLVGGLYDFAVGTFGLWTEAISTRIAQWGVAAADKYKVVFGLNTSAAVLGLGYIIGLKYAVIITAGSCLVWFFIVPLVGSMAEAVDPAALTALLGVTAPSILNDPQQILTPENLYQYIGRPIGIGGIAMAGLIGIVRQAGIIRSALGLAVTELGGKKQEEGEGTAERTQRDLTMKLILTVLVAALLTTFVFFQFGVLNDWMQSVVAILIVFLIAFLFTTVAANAIAIVGTNPVSGMTLMTLILSSLILVSVGLTGTSGMTAALIIGGVVCTALSMAGGFITDLKIGYWLGTTPRKQEAWKFLGTIISAATVAGVLIILNKTYGFDAEANPEALVAPQANAMAAVIKPLMTGGQTPWGLYFIGAALALVLTAIGIPALAFALGMFIPMNLNAPLVVGGLIAWFVSGRSKDAALNKARTDRGTLIASGFIAGGALMGVVSALLSFYEVDWKLTEWAASNAAEWTGLAAYGLLIGYFVWHTLQAKKEE
ncbi:oligopeptide transporter, OPT family [uncultured Alistipes sp.]|uniref:OPT family oligopeptide transporter n=1 Tax=uncultured Alistipes sp. TaxID=538949 RepID=UPI00261791F4|nr:oligopeptide transporter, OPT family [uncultured Alistipes sp.]